MKRTTLSRLIGTFLFIQLTTSCQKSTESASSNDNGYSGPAKLSFSLNDSSRTWIGDKDSSHITGSYIHVSHQYNYVQSDCVSESGESMWWRVEGITGLNVAFYPYQIPGSMLGGFINIAGNTWYYDSNFVLTITNVHNNMVDGQFGGSCHLIGAGSNSPGIIISNGEFQNLRILVDD